VSDNCFDTTGSASAGLPGLTIGEQIAGMWKSIAEIIDINTSEFHPICCHNKIINTQVAKPAMATNLNNPHPVSPRKES
jgi:hypothetical protein